VATGPLIAKVTIQMKRLKIIRIREMQISQMIKLLTDHKLNRTIEVEEVVIKAAEVNINNNMIMIVNKIMN